MCAGLGALVAVLGLAVTIDWSLTMSRVTANWVQAIAVSGGVVVAGFEYLRKSLRDRREERDNEHIAADFLGRPIRDLAIALERLERRFIHMKLDDDYLLSVRTDAFVQELLVVSDLSDNSVVSAYITTCERFAGNFRIADRKVIFDLMHRADICRLLLNEFRVVEHGKILNETVHRQEITDAVMVAFATVGAAEATIGEVLART